jgi:hypothetical protein
MRLTAQRRISARLPPMPAAITVSTAARSAVPEPRHRGRELLLRFTRAGLFSEVGLVLLAGG